MPPRPRRLRPYVVCHMMPSVDGRLRTDRWPIPDAAHEQYDRTADRLHADAWMCGRVTMEEFADGHWRGRSRARRGAQPKRDHVADSEAPRYGIALDPEGKLEWSKPEVEGDHLIVVTSSDAPAAYLEHLRDRGISYVLGGHGHDLDLRLVLRKLRRNFGIERLLLEGGGEINGSFLRAGLIDELSLLVTPVADGTPGEPALFDVETGRKPKRAVAKLRFASAKPVSAGMVWLRYAVQPKRRAARTRHGRR